MTTSAGQSGIAIRNRLEKNAARLKSWAHQFGLEAYRIYERDIPDFPFIVDRYKDYFVVYDRSDEVLDQAAEKRAHLPQLVEALEHVFKADQDHIIIKRRQRQKGEQQYEKLDQTGAAFTVREGPAQFKVNLYDYLDTGLFLDHRIMREKIRQMSQGRDMLNLFSYTGSVSVFSALGGARTTSVDMSATYTEWAHDNFRLNNIALTEHRFITENALEYLSSAARSRSESFDLIFCDPPTFSNSKKMTETFEVERDQEFLVDGCMRLLRPEGVLFFSNNKRSFKIVPALLERYTVKNITEKTIPKDFRDPKIHHVFEIRHKVSRL